MKNLFILKKICSLVNGISKAIRDSKATLVYNCNLVNKKGHTENFDLDDYVSSINGFIGAPRINFVTFNTKKPAQSLVEKYESNKELLVNFDPEKIANRSYKIIKSDLLSRTRTSFSKSDKLAGLRSFIRHDSDRLAKLLIMISELEEYKNLVKEII